MSVRYESPKGKLFTDFKNRKEAERALIQAAVWCLVVSSITALVASMVGVQWLLVSLVPFGCSIVLLAAKVRWAALVLIVSTSVGGVALIAGMFSGYVPFTPRALIALPVLVWFAFNAERAARFLASAPPELPPAAASR